MLHSFRQTALGTILILAVAALALVAIPMRAENISPLGARPDWKRLEGYQRSITREEFSSLLDNVYAQGNAAKGLIQVKDTHALIKKGSDNDWFRLEFAAGGASRAPYPRYWKMPQEVPFEASRPLRGLHIALDPGHIGGAWARMEERWFQIGNDKPIMEGEMTLIVARLLETRLKAQGAKVSYVRKANRPVTHSQPTEFRKLAISELQKKGIQNPQENYLPGWPSPGRNKTIQGYSEQLFYRTAEISARAQLVNRKLKPDLVLCLHFNAEDWGNPQEPRLTTTSHLHALVNGKYSAEELAFDDQRFEMMLKLLNRSYAVEVAYSRPVMRSMAAATGLPAYTYFSGNASVVPGEPYIWERNLRANRLYECPTVFLEPYIMNSRLDYERMQIGDYEGLREVGGMPRKSIYREYADSVVDGLVAAVKELPGR